VKTRQLIAWEKAGLFPTLPAGEQYSFEHLSRIHTLGKLRSKRLPLGKLRAGIEAMQAAGLKNALHHASAVRQGSRGLPFCATAPPMPHARPRIFRICLRAPCRWRSSRRQ
jgi:DNA-binding transcriptional MerR regulator